MEVASEGAVGYSRMVNSSLPHSRSMTRDLQTLRGKIFFWLGIAVFPLFWVLWMSPR
jgi:hypothetical protein